MVRGEHPPCLTLLTDYGWQAGFVGALHLVAFQIAPGANVIDLDHSVPAGDVRLGALRLERFARFLPVGVHVGVVDPGVGGTRRPIAIEAAEHCLIGPDNGLLLWAAERLGGPDRAVVLDNERYHLATKSRTFDGRDVFVPVAAHVLRGATLDEVGSRIELEALVRIERPRAVREPGTAIVVELLQVDGFGNVQFGADREDAEDLGLSAGDRVLVTDAEGGGEVYASFGSTFSDVSPGAAVLLVDSDGRLALSVNGGRADVLLESPRGAEVRIARISH